MSFSKMTLIPILFLFCFTEGLYASVNSLPLVFLGSSNRHAIQQRTVHIITQDVNGVQSTCSGYLVSRTQVYSAGHCFSNATRFVGVRIYNPITSSYQMIHPTDITMRHRDGLDSAVVQFEIPETPIIQNGAYNIPINNNMDDCDPNRPVYTAGFGMDSNENMGNLNFTRQQFESSFYFDENGQRVPPSEINTYYLTPSQGRVCGGDSGGPVFCYVRGALSYVGIVVAISSEDSTINFSSGTNANNCRHANSTIISSLIK